MRGHPHVHIVVNNRGLVNEVWFFIAKEYHFNLATMKGRMSVPYNLLATVGVWRSASRYQGPSSHADLARFTTLIVMVLLTVT